ncbi:hypothetical protein QBC35DRAFT_3934 [Podospora australis]|uniref:Uncharacterized protein n=1 Tax=Podospora australis TaxID=1536484 RepID=A0AAN6X6C8_9PEZI|nr:hypothetical protein QBC35DRAFT_3934 [Podospora australis]
MWTTRREAPAGSETPSPFAASSDLSSHLPLYPVSCSEHPLMAYQLYAEKVDYQQEDFCQTRSTSSSSTSTTLNANMGNWFTTQVNTQHRIGVATRVFRGVAGVAARIPGGDAIFGALSPRTSRYPEIHAEEEDQEPSHRISTPEDVDQTSYFAPRRTLPKAPGPQRTTSAYPHTQATGISPSNRPMVEAEERARHRAQSGVDWTLAEAGMSLVMHARNTQHDPVHRHIFVSGVSAFLRALPRDLSPGESHAFREILPPTLTLDEGLSHKEAAPDAPETRNRVHILTLLALNLVATTWFWLAPKLRYFTSEAARIEHEHEIVASTLCWSVAMAKSASQWFLNIFPKELVIAVTGYILQGVLGATAEFYDKPPSWPMKSQRENEEGKDRRMAFLQEFARPRP